MAVIITESIMNLFFFFLLLIKIIRISNIIDQNDTDVTGTLLLLYGKGIGTLNSNGISLYFG